MIARRQTIQVPGRGRVHSPVPEGIKVGEFIFSSLMGPTGPDREQERNAAEDAELLFQRIQDLVVAGGGTPENIVEMAVYVFDDDDREAINGEWLKMFPDANDRPARHILNVSPHGTHWRFAARFTAILDDTPASAREPGKLAFSPLLVGRLPGTGALPADPRAQAEAMFEEIKKWAESAGGSLDNIGSVMIYLMGDEYRKPINEVWAKIFPDRSNLPARQTLVVTPAGLQEGLFAAAVTALI
jgi:enamine deaminase RidA (YjgF/YER057c/UK114 family)